VQAWTAYADGPFAQAPVGSAGGWWTVGADGSLQTSSDGASWTTVAFPGAAAGVSAGLDGTIWAATTEALYCSDPGSQAFLFVGNGQFAQAPVGSPTALWTVGPDGGLWRSADGGSLWVQDHSYHGEAKQVSVCADGSVWIIDQNGTASLAQNWIRVMRPTGMPGSSDIFTEAVAGVDTDGTRYVFGIANGNFVYGYELGHHAWPEFSVLSQDQISGLGITNQQDTGALIVYAPPIVGQIYYGMRSPDGGYSFILQTIDVLVEDISADLELCAIDDNN
jgi:hypothetical protein